MVDNLRACTLYTILLTMSTNKQRITPSQFPEIEPLPRRQFRKQRIVDAIVAIDPTDAAKGIFTPGKLYLDNDPMYCFRVQIALRPGTLITPVGMTPFDAFEANWYVFK